MIWAQPASAQHKKVDPWLGADKVKHFLMAGFVESVTFAGLEAVGANRSTARVAGLSTAAIISVAREVHDRKVGKGFSVKDLAWDGLGIAAALLVINKTR
jgi:uncharacterized protein YfiM (DUF2279 family)